MNDGVEIVPYNAEWPALFVIEAALIKSALGDNCIAIHHIGSTAVPGLNAKPIIDILPVVKDILQVDQFNSAMQNLGYDAKGEFGMPFRRFFQKSFDKRTHHVHIFEEGNPEIDRHLRFRDWMRSHSHDRDAYGILKAKLALRYPNDRMSYSLGKDAFITDIDSKAGFNGLRMVQALTDREWNAVRHLRQKYFFDRVPVHDPYTWTFEHSKHVHFVLYKGTRIIGYTHIQLWPENRAAMRIIVIDELFRNKGIGSEFLTLCERWLLHQKINKLLIQSSPAAYQFYCKNEYVKMPFNDPDGYKGDPQDIEIGKIIQESINANQHHKNQELGLPLEYQQIPEYFDAHNINEQTPAKNALIEKLLREQKVKTVLDMTCGTGSQVFYLAEKGYEVIGSDFSPALIVQARNKAKNMQRNITFIDGDMRNIKVGKFDAVITIFNAIGHLSKADFEKALKNIHANLTNDGVYVFDIFNIQAITDEVINDFKLDIVNVVNGVSIRNIQYSEIDRENGLLISHDYYTILKKEDKSEIRKNSFSLQIYTATELKLLLKRNGFEIVRQYDMNGNDFVEEESLNILTVARKK